MIAIPDIDMPKNCAECFRILKCKAVPRWVTADDSIPKSCPLIDIVTCGECKHWYNDADCGMACEFTNMKQPSDGFCNWGERRSDERANRILADRCGTHDYDCFHHKHRP